MSRCRLPPAPGRNGVVEGANGPMASNLPKLVVPGCAAGSTARGNSAALVGMPVTGWLAPATWA